MQINAPGELQSAIIARGLVNVFFTLKLKLKFFQSIALNVKEMEDTLHR